MSTEINIEKLYENCIKILTDLIGFKTISGDDNSNLINYCEEYLQKLGATSFKTFDEEKKRVNLFATFKAKKTNGIKPIILSGHTDTVPVSKSWSTDPFKATIKDDKLYGRGACDMKGFIACVLAYAPIYSKVELNRDIHFSFTFDEETACLGAPILIEELKKRKIQDGIRDTWKSRGLGDVYKRQIKDDKLYGRGACDMKGFIACVLAYAPIYSKVELNRDIHFSFTFDEETACLGAPILICL